MLQQCPHSDVKVFYFMPDRLIVTFIKTLKPELGIAMGVIDIISTVPCSIVIFVRCLCGWSKAYGRPMFRMCTLH